MDARSALLRAIAQAGRDRAALNRRTAAELVSRAEVTQAITAQQRTLRDAHEQLNAAIMAATRAATEVRAGPDPASAEPYDRTAALLRDQLAVIETSLAQLAGLVDTAALTAGRVHRLLRDSADGVNAALLIALRQLGDLERLERARVVSRQEPPEPS